MTNQEIITQTNEALVQEFELEGLELKPESLLYEDLGLDSLDSVDMVILFEQSFDIKIGKDPDILAIKTLNDLHNYVLGKVNARKSA